MLHNLHPGKFLGAFLRNIKFDVERLGQRLRQPAGISLLIVSANQRPQNFDELIEHIEFLFPAQKCIFQTFDLTKQLAREVPWGWGLRLTRLRVLFKGGLFVRVYRLAGDADLLPVTRTHTRYLYPSRAFVCMEDSTGKLYFAHIKSGFAFTRQPAPESPAKDFSNALVEFVSNVLERQNNQRQARPGRFCVLIGLDGSGKTTLARELCDLAMRSNQFQGCRYFHWRPSVRGKIELPLPDFREQPRKRELPRTPVNSALSMMRLAKNVLLANLAYSFRIRSLLRNGNLVLVDRYFYNYFLDPVSVKYYGPEWLLKWACNWFPRPDIVIRLAAPAEVLLGRKRELSVGEIQRQTEVLQTMQFEVPQVIDADASRPATEVAAGVMREILNAKA